ncbi:DUF29 domain-containing protein [Crocosphaera sp. UHCC 0190]|uniref:DUF29 domain-containing protein n=1 Tax=Crocosphaera sp. UHCC 0190 TaxID=3110246 RepID=UPI002B20FA87|nr:DUF29 domain-containing protein [Crocosphaera sp. UHCC 0190]MEA5510433.1 DUF29 domain-containing protein [Crocosphaera sp. UHCC 0190]
MKNSLYDTDFVGWVFTQVQALKDRNPDFLDWDNLKEEIESLGKEQLNAVNSLLKQVIIHRLKLDYLNDNLNKNHWETEINGFVDQIEDRLTATLRNKIDLPKIYSRSKRDLLKQYPKLSIPQDCSYTLDDLLITFD